MSVSEGRPPAAGTAVVVELTVLPYTDPVVHGLVEQVQQEYVRRYGGRDDAPVDPAEFAPPLGVFLVAWLAGEPVGCGGWRRLPVPGAVEVKRMYVAPPARGRGVARAILAELERSAAAAGAAQVLLETGIEQPEALALYRSSGYLAVPGFGHHAGRPKARSFGKPLLPATPGEVTRPGDRRTGRSPTNLPASAILTAVATPAGAGREMEVRGHTAHLPAGRNGPAASLGQHTVGQHIGRKIR